MFTVNNRAWTIRFVSPKNPMLMRSDGSWTIGTTDGNTNTVYIADNLSGYMLDKVLCHELCHVFCFSWDIYIPIEEEERLCQFMSEYGRDIIYLLDNLMDILQFNIA